MSGSAEDAFAAWLGRRLELAATHGHKGYLVLDQSGLPDTGALAALLQDLPWRNLLLAGERTDALDGASPVLVALPSPGAAARLARHLHVPARHATCVSVLIAPLTLEALHQALRERTELLLPEGLHMVLRYFDTRTLPLLPRLLTRAQYDAFVGCTAAWHYLDRSGAVQSLPAPADATPPAFVPPLVLSVEQERMLIDDGLCDAVIDQLLDHGAPALQDLTPPEQHARVAPLVERGRRWRLHDVLPSLQYVDAALREGDDFDTRAPWAERFAAYLQGRVSLDEVLQA